MRKCWSGLRYRLAVGNKTIDVSKFAGGDKMGRLIRTDCDAGMLRSVMDRLYGLALKWQKGSVAESMVL